MISVEPRFRRSTRATAAVVAPPPSPAELARAPPASEPSASVDEWLGHRHTSSATTTSAATRIHSFVRVIFFSYARPGITAPGPCPSRAHKEIDGLSPASGCDEHRPLILLFEGYLLSESEGGETTGWPAKFPPAMPLQTSRSPADAWHLEQLPAATLR